MVRIINFLFFALPVLFIALFAGWVNNIIWTFQQHDYISLLLGIVGIFVAPLGAVHGLLLFFA